MDSNSTPAEPILPGAALGVLGSGQLGKMFAMAAARLGYRVHVFAPDADAPAGDASYRQTFASFEDEEAVAAFAQTVDVVTFEFENIPIIAAETAARFAPVRPTGRALHIAQDRLREKRFLQEAGVACTPFAEVTSAEDLDHALDQIGAPAVLKTAAWGYDGKGQAMLDTRDDAVDAWRQLGQQPAILEGFVDFHCELSVIAARTLDDAVAMFGPVANAHSQHILDVSVAPRPELQSVAAEANEVAAAILRGLDVVGLICVEFFLDRSGRLLVNEIAPRPHNSGHMTIDACACSQFEQQVRAVCGLPLGSFQMRTPAAAMANLLGDLWHDGTPRWSRVLADPHLHLHLYGKSEARPGRKMGHITALAGNCDEAERLARLSREMLVKM